MPLTPREAEIMNLLWTHGPLTVREALEHLDDDPPYTSVLSIFQTLRRKNHVRAEQEGRAYRHHPITTRFQALWDAFEELDRRYCAHEGQLAEVAKDYLGVR